MKNNYIKESFIEVFAKKKYVFLSVIISFLVFSLFIVVNNINMFTSAVKLSPKLVFDVFFAAVPLIYFAKGFILFSLIVLISLLAGINLTLLTYKFSLAMPSSDKGSIIGFAGIIGGALSSGCSACTLPLISILGISSSFAVLPLKGEEFTILAIVLLLISLYLTSKSIVSKTCKVKLINRKNKKK